MTVREALRNSFPFHVTESQLETVAVSRGLVLNEEYSSFKALDKSFELAKADIIKLVVMSPNVSEGGVSISFTDRNVLISIANGIYGKYGEPLFGQETPTVRPLDW